jgi:hypothetical protein
MDRPWIVVPILTLLSALAIASLAWGAHAALTKDNDLTRRCEEVALFVQQVDPYQDPDMTYPPSALPVFTPLIAPFSPRMVRVIWLILNVLSLGVLATSTAQVWGREWPPWLRFAFPLILAASKPARLAIGMGQFAILPTALILLSLQRTERRREVLGGLLLGVALVKPTLAVPFLIALTIQRRWITVSAAASFQVCTFLGASLWLHISPVRLLREWVALARGQQGAGLIDLPTLAKSVWPESASHASSISLLALVFVTALLFAFRDRALRELTALSLLLAAVFTYHRPYDLVLLFPALAILLDEAERSRSGWVTLAGIVATIVLIIPSDRRIVGNEMTFYNPVFIATSYGLLAVLLARLVNPRGFLARPDPVLGEDDRTHSTYVDNIPTGPRTRSGS